MLNKNVTPVGPFGGSSVAWASITGTPTTIAGYGITDHGEFTDILYIYHDFGVPDGVQLTGSFGYYDGLGTYLECYSPAYASSGGSGNFFQFYSRDDESALEAAGPLRVYTSDVLTLQEQPYNVRRATATNTTITTDDYLIAVTDTSVARTITLPLAGSVGASATYIREFVIKDESGGAGTNTITITRSGGNTIDGANDVFISSNHGKVTVFSNGTNWFTK